MKQQVIINNRREEVRGTGTGRDGVVFDTVVRESLCGSDIQVMTGMKGKNKALMIWENSFQDQGYRKSQGPEVGRSLKVSRKSKRDSRSVFSSAVAACWLVSLLQLLL